MIKNRCARFQVIIIKENFKMLNKRKKQMKMKNHLMIWNFKISKWCLLNKKTKLKNRNFSKINSKICIIRRKKKKDKKLSTKIYLNKEKKT